MILGESAGKNIDDLLIEADKIIGETLPYFQTSSNTNKVITPKDFKNIQKYTRITPTQSKIQRKDTKKVIFNLKNNSQSILIPKKNFKSTEINGLY